MASSIKTHIFCTRGTSSLLRTKYSHKYCEIRDCTATTSSYRLGGKPRGRWSILVGSPEFRARGNRSCSLVATKTRRIVRRVPNIQNTRHRCLRTCTCQGHGVCNLSNLQYEYLRPHTCRCPGHVVCHLSTLRRTNIRWRPCRCRSHIVCHLSIFRHTHLRCPTCRCRDHDVCHLSILRRTILRRPTCRYRGHAVCFLSILRRTHLCWHTCRCRGHVVYCILPALNSPTYSSPLARVQVP